MAGTASAAAPNAAERLEKFPTSGLTHDRVSWECGVLCGELGSSGPTVPSIGRGWGPDNVRWRRPGSAAGLFSWSESISGQNWKFEAMASSQVMTLARVDGRPAHDVGQVGQRGPLGLVVRPVVADRVQQHVPLGLPRADGLLAGASRRCCPARSADPCRSAPSRRECCRRTGPRTSCRGRRWRTRCSTWECSAPRRRPWCRRRRSTRWRRSRGSGCNRCCWRRGRRRRGPRPDSASLSQQISSIWWMSISANSPPETHKNFVKLRICQNSSFSVAAAAAQRADGFHAVGADQLDLAQLAVADPLDQLLAVARVAAHQPGGDLEVLLLGRLARLDHAPHGRRVGGERLLHEDVDALFHGIFQVPRGGKPA